MAIQPTLFETEIPGCDFSRGKKTPVSSVAGSPGRWTPKIATSEPSDDGAKNDGPSNDGPNNDGPSETVTAAPLDGALKKEAILRQLRSQVGCVTAAPADTVEIFSTGSAGADRLLPRGGLRVDGISEWITAAEGCGAAAISMIAAASRLNSVAGPLLVVAGEGVFYPPAAMSLGIPAERIIWARPTRHADVVWAIDQGLRCERVAAVWAHLGPNLDDRDARRFQLAAETGHTPGLFIRPSSVRGRPSFADVRLHVAGSHGDSEPATKNDQVHQQRRERDLAENRHDHSMREAVITLDRCRGGAAGQSVTVRIDDHARLHEVTRPDLSPKSYPIEAAHPNETATVRLASELAHPTSPKSARQKRRLA